MATNIYTIRDIIANESHAFPTLGEAQKFRTEMFDKNCRPDIMKETLADMPKKQLLCALYNRSQYRTDQVVAVPADFD